MHWRSLACSAALLSTLQPALAQGLSPVESKLVESVKSRTNDQIAALQKVVDIDSGTLNATGVREVGRYFETELQGLGFKTRWVSMPETMHRAGHLIAERVASGGSNQRVLLLGHLDTVFELDSPGDEESVGVRSNVSRRDVLEAARQSDVVLSFEPDTGKAVIGRRGLSTWSLQTTGVQGHSAFVLKEKGGAGAVYEIARILDEVRRAFTGHPTVTINPGLVLGGTAVTYDDTKAAGAASGKFNIVAPASTVKGDLRFLSDADRDGAKTRMREIASTNLLKTSAKFEFDDLAPGWPASPGNQKLLSEVGNVSRALGMGPVEAEDPVNRGFGDVNFIGTTVAGIDGLGAKGEGFHGPDESIDLNSLGPATSRAAVLIYRVTHQRRP